MVTVSSRLYWRCQIVGWGVLAIAYSLVQIISGGGPEPWRLVVISLGSSTCALAWTHAYRGAIRRWRWADLGLAHLVRRVLVASILLGTAIAATITPIWGIVVGVVGPLHAWMPWAMVSWSSSVAVWSALYFGVHYFARARALEIEQLQLAIVAKDAQIHGLMSQLQPHFLFNCLNSVRSLIAEDPAKAQTTVTALSNLMRYSLRGAIDPTVPLATELEMVRTYLALEAVRFEERLRTEIEVTGDTADQRVPAMLIQSLVENGVKHGIERAPAGGTIRVAIRCEPAALHVRVTNPGRLGASPPSTRIGLANARERLRLLHGADASLSLTDDGHTVTAVVSIPRQAPSHATLAEARP